MDNKNKAARNDSSQTLIRRMNKKLHNAGWKSFKKEGQSTIAKR
jgi:hypothetical protein